MDINFVVNVRLREFKYIEIYYFFYLWIDNELWIILNIIWKNRYDPKI